MPFDPPGDSLIAPGQARPSAPPFHVRYNPVSSALWCAMQMPGEAILGPPPSNATALDLVVRTVFQRAIAGDVRAFAIIADRLEGRVGIRSDETDPASDVAREGVQQAIEEIVTAFTEARLDGPDDTPGDGAQMVEGNATTAPAPEPRTSGLPARPADERLMPDGDGHTNGQSNGAGWRDGEPLRGY